MRKERRRGRRFRRGNHAQGAGIAPIKWAFLRFTCDCLSPRRPIKSERSTYARRWQPCMATVYDEALWNMLKQFSTDQAEFLFTLDDAVVIAGRAPYAMEIMRQHPDPVYCCIYSGGGGRLTLARQWRLYQSYLPRNSRLLQLNLRTQPVSKLFWCWRAGQTDQVRFICRCTAVRQDWRRASG